MRQIVFVRLSVNFPFLQLKILEIKEKNDNLF
jgi:hypothetical protein